jgi:Tfp pilus tip-associated adhesin PilY1
MKCYPFTRSSLRHLISLALTASLVLPLPALSASVALATAPLTSSTTTSVSPNLMFMLDDSGSMDWDYMPDDAKNFSGKYGYNTNHCNGVYYNPAITYTPPIDSTGKSYSDPTSTSYINNTFNAAYKSGYKTSLGTVNLDTGFTGGSGSGSSGATGYSGPAFYYTYSGTQTAGVQMDFHNTASIFYKECISAIDSTTKVDGVNPVNTVFKKVRLASTATTTITITAPPGGGATITITAASSARVNNITVSGVGGGQIVSGQSSSSSTTSTVATNIASKINTCTASVTGNCTVSGYSATVSGSVITIIGPAAGGATLTINVSSGSMTSTKTAFPAPPSTAVSSIRVNGVELLLSGSTAATTSANTLATSVAAGINATGYSATASANIVTITGPASASTYTPVITTNPTSGGMTLATDAFPESTPAKLQNFANWYSYYSNRMLMMKTGVGQAFAPLTDKYRVGFMTMNNNISPGIVEIAPFDATQKLAWYTKLYASAPGNSTPLREALSHVGQMYAHKFGNYTYYTATITVSGSGSTGVDGITVSEGGVPVETMANSTTPSTSTSAVATNIAAQINTLDPSNYGASVSSNKITITGPASALGRVPQVNDDGGGMTFSATAFTAINVTAQLNGITPKDPVQYSCQQNFVILSTDGYWNGSTTYDLSTPNQPVGNQDGTAPRPMYDGGLFTKTTSRTYQRQEQTTKTTSQLKKKTVQEQKQISQLRQDVGTAQYKTSTLQTRTGILQGTLSKVLMKCNNTAAICGTAPASGVAGGGWTVVAGTCTLAASVQCSVVSGLSGNTNAATQCDTSASITTSGVTYATFTITVTGVSSNTTFTSIKIGGVEILTGTTSQSNSNNGVASAIPAKVGNGYTATVSSNVVTVTKNGAITSASSITASSLGKGAATLTGAVIGTNGGTYTLNNADSNGNVYSACTYNWGSWNNAVAVCSVNQSASNPYSVISATNCQYAVPGTSTAGWSAAWTNGSCTAAAQNNTNLTAKQCQRTWITAQATPSCSAPADVAGDYTAATTYKNCATVVTSPYANATCGAGDVTTVPDASGNTTQCQTLYNGLLLSNGGVNDFIGAASCANSGPTNGLTVYCPNPNPVVTGPDPIDPTNCTTNQTAGSGNNYVGFTCTTTTIQPATLVASCIQGNSGAPNYIQSYCTTSTLSTTNNATSCTPGNSGSPNYIQTACTGGIGGTSDTLADVAMYYYQTDLRNSSLANCTGGASTDFPSGTDVCQDNVFINDVDKNTKQHLTTYTLGLGARGRMVYSSKNYINDTSGDFYSVKTGASANTSASPPICSWQTTGSICNWPTPASGAIENIDDLWHAAVNGRGTYFSATDPAALSDGLASALSSITARKGAAAAAATSTLNPVAGNNLAYLASYTTVKWTGNLEARGININNGNISTAATWCVENLTAGTCTAPSSAIADTSGSSTVYNCVTPNSTATNCTSPSVFDPATNNCSLPIAMACTGTLPPMVGATSDTRKIYTSNGTALVDFIYANLNPANFDASHIGALSQWAALTSTQQATAVGANLVNFLRGQSGYEDRAVNLAGPTDNRIYRFREAVLGDILESQPFYMGPPVFSYIDAGYDAYKAAKAARPGTVYVGANDGMLHAFVGKSDTTLTPPEVGGTERWAYIPSMLIPNLWKLADKSYDIKHTNFINGSVNIADFYCTANCGGPGGAAQWRTILVGSLNAGGRGYYALDVTDQLAPKLLWEFTTTTATKLSPYADDNVGYSFGNPIITKLANGTWVVLVTSGYNNTSPGDGKGYLYVLNATTGAIISTIPTGVGSTTTPSGLGKIAAWNNVPASNQAGYTYGGDLLGNVWRFDINAAISTGVNPFKFATLFSDSAGTNPQPITTVPVLGQILDKRIVFIGTGKYLETSDLTNTQIQTQYAIKDDDATSTFVNPRNTLVQQTLAPVTGSTTSRTGSSNTVDFSTGRGWYANFPDSGERVNIDSQLVSGILLVPTLVPSNTVCTPGGYGWFNFFDYKTGGLVINSEQTDSPVVGFNITYEYGKGHLTYVTAGGDIIDPPVQPPIEPQTTGYTGKRVIWRELY